MSNTYTRLRGRNVRDSQERDRSGEIPTGRIPGQTSGPDRLTSVYPPDDRRQSLVHFASAMMDDQDRFTATLSQLQRQEVMSRRPGQLRLEISDAAGKRTVTLRQTEVTGGSADGNAIVLQDSKVSRVHFQLQVQGEGALLCDLGSRNGTHLGDAIVREAPLRAGDSFRVGEHTTIKLLGVDSIDTPMSTQGRFGDCYAQCSKMKQVFSRLERIASFDIDVLIEGESGTGKELIARAIHSKSSRKAGPFIVLDSTTLKSELVESTLFGHKKGAFTGAINTTKGLLEAADGGSLFLDEVGELSLPLQTKLLRALQERQFLPVGETGSHRTFDARVIAATHQDLQRMVNTKDFRLDLYFRIAKMKATLPPLRERGRVDIIFLANRFVEHFSGGRKTLTKAACDRLANHHWPGNVRELQGVIETSVLLGDADSLTQEDINIQEQGLLTTPPPELTDAYATLAAEALRLEFSAAVLAFKRAYASKALAGAEGNKTEAARRSGMGLTTLKELLKPEN